ncbi:hypothetical protein LWM68_40940 [Niabella sp. W65]|nr:hypothetical protein [Niabella sp. W65]MCH7368540.1 hypothetical protein [Niabella sp. W65]ULT44129.1 hypothetical protein KRR40_12635 [Niabella sp. I65]
MVQAAINFFKRNPKGVACHVVLDQTFSSASAASVYKKAVRAHKVSVFTRKEYDAFVKAQELKDKIAEPPQNVKEA